MNEFHSKSMLVSPICSRFPTNTIGYIVLYYNRLIMVFIQRIHKPKQKSLKNMFKSYSAVSTVESQLKHLALTAEQLAYRGWHNRQGELLTGGERGYGN